jgi:hypothetical protein
VVIPPMQICPGDLLVYSKVLTHRNNVLGEFQCNAMKRSVKKYMYWHIACVGIVVMGNIYTGT